MLSDMPAGRPREKKALSPFGQRLRGLIAKKHENRSRFLYELDLKPMTIYRYETGDRLPPAELTLRLAKHFGVTTDFLLGADPVQPEPAEMDPVLQEFLASPFGQDVTPAEVEALQTRVRFHTPSLRAYHFALLAFREEI